MLQCMQSRVKYAIIHNLNKRPVLYINLPYDAPNSVVDSQMHGDVFIAR